MHTALHPWRSAHERQTLSAPGTPRPAGNTETVAGYVSAATGMDAVDIADCAADDIAAADCLVIGAPTWHTGADTERSGTAWDEFLYGDLTGLDLKGKKVAVFGCGDQSGYGCAPPGTWG